ncbi:hypothetical protein ASZ90_010147 [hydrocarbon metagenome]|uniref:Uncharacterized protein n=1 Tax=hydrocarbon metagenome TaxID=938273 RepID=A0A0W8FGV5_9ZZZZ
MPQLFRNETPSGLNEKNNRQLRLRQSAASHLSGARDPHCAEETGASVL